jgi:hypothetical protein
MNEPMMNDILAVVRWPAADRLGLLMDRVKPPDLTTQEILALAAVFESADQRVNAHTAPVLQLIPTSLRCRSAKNTTSRFRRSPRTTYGILPRVWRSAPG